MKLLFYLGILLWITFEIANVYFIMPMPGSQRMNSIDLAYFLYSWRWPIRALAGLFILIGFFRAFKSSKWLSGISIVIALVVFYYSNFKMAAEVMFYQPKELILKNIKENKVEKERLVVGITYQGEAKAYPIQFIGYHHQVKDKIGGKPVMITYCTVCRTGRVFEPLVEGKYDEFRLVGMDHFNAMFEDKSTGTWWRQVNGKAVAGKLKGKQLPEFESMQTTLEQWIKLYPHTLIMQADPNFKAIYDSLSNYETGKRKGALTKRDTASWQEKSWVIGVELNQASKAYDWNELQKKKIIYDVLDNQPIMVLLAQDKQSFAAFKRNSNDQKFTLKSDTLVNKEGKYNFLGHSLDNRNNDLPRLKAYQEYWHSWQTFHPNTQK